MDRFKKYIDYIHNTGGNPKIEWFIDDWEPIGAKILIDMEKAGLIRTFDGRILLINE